MNKFSFNFIFLIIVFLYIIPSKGFVAWYKAKNIDFPTKCKVGYNVYKGDTCESIAKKFNIKLIDFKRMNSFPCEDLSASDKVCIGGTYVKCQDWKLVLKGTTCEGFMKDNNMSEEEFKRLNPKINCNRLITEPYLFFCTLGDVIDVTYTM
ncbi:hypothetical protein H8356DRAFT_1700039 [Neocallimastix lanati (nom. inval.)]|jgi:hypothetical protein|nr:hypothetical protein H8356DRAFT_1700039 [Neocallimastix sp. JGI-2020a]